MANFLDLTTGLPALWAKIKSKFYTKAEVDALIPEDEVMVVNIGWDDVNQKYVADKTAQEITEFVNNGGVAVVNNYDSYLLCNNGISDVTENYYLAAFSYAAVENAEGSTFVYGGSITIKHENGIESVNITQGNNSIPSPANDNDGLPIMDGTASRGDSINYARANHVHPSDTSKADKWYGYCTSGEQAQNKEVTINGFTSTNLVAGTKVTIKFRYSNQADQPTLNISGTGAKPILTTGIAINNSQEVNRQTAMAYEWNSGIFTFVYDGYANWIMESQQHATTSYFGVTKLSNTISNDTTTALTPSAVYNAGYALSSDVLTKTNTTSYTPTANYHPATKKYVDDAIPSASSTSPKMDGAAAVGVSTTYARADHVHPTDTSRVAVNQGTANAGKVLTVGSDGNVALTSDIVENFIVNATNSGSNYTVDKTYNEIVEAFNSGKNCFCIWTNGNGNYHVHRLHAILNNTIHFIYFFEADANSIWAYDLTINSENIVTVYGNSIRGASSNDLDYAGKNGITSNLNVNDNGYFVSRTAQNNYSSNTLFWINAKQIAKAKTDIATGDTLTKGTNYEITTIADELANMSTDLTGLADTNISNPADGQVLQYDSTSSKWVNGDVSSVLYVTITGNQTNGFATTANFDDVYAAYQDGYDIKAVNGTEVYNLSTIASAGMSFTKNTATALKQLTWAKSSGNITYNGWSASVSNLTDTTISSPTTGQILTYDGTTSKWVNSTLNTGNTYTLSIFNNVITLTGSDGSTSSVTLPVFGGTAADVWEGGAY